MKKIKLLGTFIFWLSIISAPIAFSISSVIGEADIFGIAGIVRYLWIMWAFVPIGITSMFIGIILKKYNLKYKKNYIVAFVIIPILVIFGSYRFMFSNIINYENDVIVNIEEKISVNIPNEIKIATQNFEEYKLSYAKILDKNEKYSFENSIMNSNEWLNKLNSELYNSLPNSIQVELHNFNYFMFYNNTTKEINNYPHKNGNYNCVFIAYDCEIGRLIILNDFIISIY